MGNKKRLLIQFLHIADVNFFKNAVKILKDHYDIIISARLRGNLMPILTKELKGFPVHPIGRHVSHLYKKAINEPFRYLRQVYLLSKNEIDYCTSFGAIGAGIACKLKGIPYVVYEDDELYRLDIYVARATATKLIVPASLRIFGRNVSTYSGFKELAYLHPKYFTPDKGILDYYNLEREKYLFMRQVKRTLNYRHLTNIFPNLAKELKRKGYTILLSLEEKSLIDVFERYCKVLKEPVDDIYSLLKYASLTISAGDTMARESCLLGTPAIYTGERSMAVNRELIKMKCMFIENDIQGILGKVDYIRECNIKNGVEERIRYSIEFDWDDTTEVILRHIFELFK